MTRTIVNSKDIYSPTGSPDTPFYSWTARKGNMVAISGANGLDKNKNIAPDLGGQARQAFATIKTAIESAGGTVDDIIQVTIYLVFNEPGEMGAKREEVLTPMNEAFHATFGKTPPARAVVGVSSLPKGKIQVACLAVLD